MISASEIFIQERELDHAIGIENFKRAVVILSEYKNDRLPTKKFEDENEEIEIMLEREREEDCFSNEVFEREECHE